MHWRWMIVMKDIKNQCYWTRKFSNEKLQIQNARELTNWVNNWRWREISGKIFIFIHCQIFQWRSGDEQAMLNGRQQSRRCKQLSSCLYYRETGWFFSAFFLWKNALTMIFKCEWRFFDSLLKLMWYRWQIDWMRIEMNALN